MKLKLARKLFVKKPYPECHENLTNSSGTDTRSQTEKWTEGWIDVFCTLQRMSNIHIGTVQYTGSDDFFLALYYILQSKHPAYITRRHLVYVPYQLLLRNPR
jgi:hypothetical protein